MIVVSFPMIKSTANSNIAYAEVINKDVSMVNSFDSETILVNKNAIVSNEADSVIALLLDPHIRAAIYDYYGKPMQYALYDSTINKITQVDNDFVYRVTISVPTFEGAHNPPYGIEIMTFTVRPGGIVELNNYVHQRTIGPHHR